MVEVAGVPLASDSGPGCCSLSHPSPPDATATGCCSMDGGVIMVEVAGVEPASEKSFYTRSPRSVDPMELQRRGAESTNPSSPDSPKVLGVLWRGVSIPYPEK